MLNIVRINLQILYKSLTSVFINYFRKQKISPKTKKQEFLDSYNPFKFQEVLEYWICNDVYLPILWNTTINATIFTHI